jgi:thioredoxin 1
VDFQLDFFGKRIGTFGLLLATGIFSFSGCMFGRKMPEKAVAQINPVEQQSMQVASRFSPVRLPAVPSTPPYAETPNNNESHEFASPLVPAVFPVAQEIKTEALKAPSTVHHLKEDSFESEVLRSDVPVLVDFYAEWCGPCKALAPTLDALAAETPQAKIVKINIDESPNLAARYGIKSVPSLLVFKNGAVYAKERGVPSKSRIKAMIDL